MKSDLDDRRSDVCPECGGPSRAVTSVTITTLDVTPARVLVTRQCTAATCQFKFPVVQIETRLDEDEIAVWRHR